MATGADVTHQSDDMMGGAGGDTGVFERVLYGAPDGDAAIIKQRQQIVFESEKSSYTAGQTIILDVVSRTKCLDMKKSYFSFKCKLKQGTADLTNATVAPTWGTAGSNFTVETGCRGLAGNEYIVPTTAAGAFSRPATFLDETKAATAPVTMAAAIATATLPAYDNAYKTWYRRDGTSSNFFSRMRIISRKGVVLEEITNYNDLARMFFACTWTEEEKRDRGAIYGMSCTLASHGRTNEIINFQHVDSNPPYPHTWAAGVPTGTGADEADRVSVDGVAAAGEAYQTAKFHFIPTVSGLWNIPQFLPIYLFEGIRFEFVLDVAERVLHGTGYVGAAAAQTVTSYEISEFKLVAECVELSAGVKVSLDQVLGEGGIPIYISTALQQDFSITNSTNVNIRVLDRLTHATAAWFWMVPAQTSATATFRCDNLNHLHFAPSSVQWRLGTANMPDQPIEVSDNANWRDLDPDLYAQFTKTVRGLFGNDFSKPLPVYDNWKRKTFSDTGTVNGATSQCSGNFTYYTIGQSLQTSPGVDGSGTIIGDAASLELRMKLAEAPSASYGGKMVVFYDRMLLLHDGGLVDVQV